MIYRPIGDAYAFSSLTRKPSKDSILNMHHNFSGRAQILIGQTPKHLTFIICTRGRIRKSGTESRRNSRAQEIAGVWTASYDQ